MAHRSHNFSRPAAKRSYSTIPDVDEKNDVRNTNVKALDDGEKGIVTIRERGVASKIRSISHQQHSSHSFYKPTSNRTWVLSLFLMAIGLTIGFLEFLASTRPDASAVKQLSKRDGVALDYSESDWRALHLNARYINRRQASEPPLLPTNNYGTVSSLSTSAVTGDNSINAISFVSITTQPTTLVTEPTPPVSTPTVGNNAPVNYVSVTSQDLSLSPPGHAASSNFVSITSALPTTITSGQKGLGGVNTDIITSKVASVVSNSLLVSSGSVIATISASPASSAKSETTPTPNSSAASQSVSAPVLSTLTNSAGLATATIAVAGDIILTNSKGQATATLSLAASADSVAATNGANVVVVLTNSEGQPTATISSSSPASTTAVGLHTKESGSIANLSQYFAAVYIPSIIGVILQSLWLIVFATFKMMEPFYTLARPNGAVAADSLTADYLSTGLTVSFSRAASAGHWIVILAGLIQLDLALIVTLLPDTNTVAATEYCTTALGRQPCNPRWVVNIGLTRGVEVLLVACFSMLVAIIYLNRHRCSGVYSDPSKIATMADLIVHDSLIQELRDIQPNATKLQIEHDLRQSRYMLGTYNDTETGRTEYGIIKLDVDLDAAVFDKEPFYKTIHRRMNHLSEGFSQHLNEKAPYLADALCMSMIVILFVIVLSYRLISSNSDNAFNNWMNSQTLGPSWVLTCLGVSIGFLIKRKERLLRLSHPYVLLSKGPQPSATTITAGTRATQFTGFSKGLWQGDISLAFMSMCAILSDIMLVLIPGIPFSTSSTTQLYEFSTYTVLALLAVLMSVHVRATFKQWQRGRIECPETLAGGLLRLCASRFVVEKNMREWNKELDLQDHEEGFEQDDAKKQQARYDGVNGSRRYRFAYLEGVDGVKRWMIEEDAWLSRQTQSER